MTFTEIREAITSRMTAQTAIPADAVTYPNGPVFNPSGRAIWARLNDISGLSGANEIGAGAVVHRTGMIIIQLFVPAGSRSLLITQT
ncbi:electron transfer flavoprotein subunit beta, partial [Pantoea agglomerans]|nr:electron transfer flavoprotein subunit beta [Pantoea agglomerans]